MSHKKLFATSMMGFMLILACVLPPAVAPQPIPTTDPNRLSTMVAGTSAVLMTQTAQAAELLVTPTETPYATPTRPTSGSVLTVRPDGATYFADALTGLELVIPTGWMALRIGEQEYYAAWADETSLRLGFTNILTNFSGQDPNIVRLIALDTQDGHSQTLFPANVILQTGHSFTLEEAIRIQLEHHRAVFNDFELVAHSAGELSTGIPSVSLETAYNGMSVSTGEEIRVYEKFILFSANGKTTSIKIETLDAIRAVTSPQFEQIVASLVFFTP